MHVLQELEREITFQEGSGLYYYYYKHMLTAPSFKRGMSFDVSVNCWNLEQNQFLFFLNSFFFQGLYELTLDNKTISGQTVNIVQLLFLYPELATSFIYRITSSHVSTDQYFKSSTISILAITDHVNG